MIACQQLQKTFLSERKATSTSYDKLNLYLFSRDVSTA